MTPNPSPQLLQAVRESRLAIAREYSALALEIDFRKRFQDSVRHHPGRWLGGAAALGLITAAFRGRRPKIASTVGLGPVVTTPTAGGEAPSEKSTGAMKWVLGALELAKIAYPVLRPLAVELAGNIARTSLAKRGRSL